MSGVQKLRALASVAAQMQALADSLGVGSRNTAPDPSIFCAHLALYDKLVTDQSLRTATRTLYADRHYAQAVEEGRKCLNSTVKARSGESLDGVGLMQRVFSEKHPILRINRLRTESEKNEQIGYSMIMAGLMMGIRNPRAHELQHGDGPIVALDLLVLVNHLMQVVGRSTRTRTRKKQAI